jgi:hypothetical protein
MIYPLYIISWTCSISSLHNFMDLLDILFTSFHGLARYPLYIISLTCSISSLHHFMDLRSWNDEKRISSKSMRWCKDDIEQVHAMMERGYRVSPWNDVKRIDILFTSFHGLARYPLYIISWTCSISSLHHFMDLLDILFTSFHGLARYPLYIMDIEQVHEMM